MKSVAMLAAAALLVASAGSAVAHPGGTDASGCHTNRKTGQRHCHGAGGGSSARPAAAKPARRSGAAYGSPYYANCTEARAAGAAPINRGEPGYAPHLDRDNDGVACERS